MEALTTLSPIALGFYGSLAAGLMTSVGAVPVLFGSTPSRKWRDISLGFAARVMLAASFFSLIIPALDVAEIRYGDGAIPALIVCVAILLGMGAVAIMNEVIPHEHFSSGREGPEAASGEYRKVWGSCSGQALMASSGHGPYRRNRSVESPAARDQSHDLAAVAGACIDDLAGASRRFASRDGVGGYPSFFVRYSCSGVRVIRIVVGGSPCCSRQL